MEFWFQLHLEFDIFGMLAWMAIRIWWKWQNYMRIVVWHRNEFHIWKFNLCRYDLMTCSNLITHRIAHTLHTIQYSDLAYCLTNNRFSKYNQLSQSHISESNWEWNELNWNGMEWCVEFMTNISSYSLDLVIVINIHNV